MPVKSSSVVTFQVIYAASQLSSADSRPGLKKKKCREKLEEQWQRVREIKKEEGKTKTILKAVAKGRVW